MTQAHLYAQLEQWYATAAGHESLNLIHRHLIHLQHDLFGQDALYYGPSALFDTDTMVAPMRRRFLMHPDTGESHVHGRPDALPIAACSVDLMVLGHALELSEQPHQVLREAERVLVANGHLMLIGFNPWSWYGVRRMAGPRSFPWNRHFYGLHRIRDWLTVLNLEVQECQFAAFRPPCNHPMMQRLLKGLEAQVHLKWAHFGGVYCIRARKSHIPITPIRTRWYQPISIAPKYLVGAEPTTRL